MEATEKSQKPKKLTFGELKKQLADEKAKYAILESSIEEIVESRVKKRIQEKDAYLNKVEQECEDKIANRDVIISGLQRNLADANHLIAELQKTQKVAKKSWLSKIFGK